MKKSVLFIGLFLILSVALLAQVDISYTKGEVFFQNNELYTEEGKAETYLNGNYFRLNHHTKIVFNPEEVEIRYGEVYIQAENMVKIKTPHETFSLEGLYRIEVDRYKTKKFHNPMYEDDFDKWNYRREKEIDHQTHFSEQTNANADYGYYGNYYGGWYNGWPYYYYPYYYPYYWSWCYPFSYLYWGLNPYRGWYNDYYGGYYSGYYSGYYNGYGYSSYNYDRGRTVINKNQLKRRNPARTAFSTRNLQSSAKTATIGKTYASRTNIKKIAKIPGRRQSPWGNLDDFKKGSSKVRSSRNSPRIYSSSSRSKRIASRSSSKAPSRAFSKTPSRSTSPSRSSRSSHSSGKTRKK